MDRDGLKKLKQFVKIRYQSKVYTLEEFSEKFKSEFNFRVMYNCGHNTDLDATVYLENNPYTKDNLVSVIKNNEIIMPAEGRVILSLASKCKDPTAVTQAIGKCFEGDVDDIGSEDYYVGNPDLLKMIFEFKNPWDFIVIDDVYETYHSDNSYNVMDEISEDFENMEEGSIKYIRYVVLLGLVDDNYISKVKGGNDLYLYALNKTDKKDIAKYLELMLIRSSIGKNSNKTISKENIDKMVDEIISNTFVDYIGYAVIPVYKTEDSLITFGNNRLHRSQEFIPGNEKCYCSQVASSIHFRNKEEALDFELNDVNTIDGIVSMIVSKKGSPYDFLKKDYIDSYIYDTYDEILLYDPTPLSLNHIPKRQSFDIIYPTYSLIYPLYKKDRDALYLLAGRLPIYHYLVVDIILQKPVKSGQEYLIEYLSEEYDKIDPEVVKIRNDLKFNIVIFGYVRKVMSCGALILPPPAYPINMEIRFVDKYVFLFDGDRLSMIAPFIKQFSLMNKSLMMPYEYLKSTPDPIYVGKEVIPRYLENITYIVPRYSRE